MEMRFGHETTSLDTAPKDLRRMLDALKPPKDPWKCSRCGAEKPGLALAADAAHMYENLEATQVAQTLEALIKVAASKGYVGMA
eukprot:945268-Alexandrium_andersonii.AAC.1